MTLTKKETELLKTIFEYQNERGHSDFDQTEVKTRSCAGVLSSLVKKGLVYNSYLGYTDFCERTGREIPTKTHLWCMTDLGVEVNGMGTPEYW